MRSVVGSLADGMLAYAIIIPPHPPIPPTNIRKVRGPRKSTETSNKKHLLVNEKRRSFSTSLLQRFTAESSRELRRNVLP